MLIALPNFDRSFTCTLFLPLKGPKSFEKLDSQGLVSAFFRENFPDVQGLFPDLETVFFSHPTGTMSTVRCLPWHYSDRALVLGDAAHAILPFFGQGMNCGFEDCSVLDELLENSPGRDLFSQFTALRKNNADAIADMAIENFVEMRDQVGDPRFMLRKSVEGILMEAFPTDFVTRYSLVTFSNIPYKMAMDLGKTGDEILNEICQDLDRPEKVSLERAERLIQTKMSSALDFAKENYHGPWN